MGVISLKGGVMEKINLPFFYQLGGQLNPLTQFKYDNTKRLDALLATLGVQTSVSTLLSSFPVLQVCRDAGTKLGDAIQQTWDWFRNADKEKLSVEDSAVDRKFQNVIDKAKEFEIVLSAELRALAAYHVTQKGIYSTTDLIDRAEYILPEPTLPKVNQLAKDEIRQSGKCLAFDSGTACAFHIMRAVEMIMHEYYLKVCKPKPKPKKRLPNWGEYIKKFQNSTNAEVKEMAVLLQQIKDQHRNLIMHPEVSLTVDEAFALFEIAQGVIISMAAKLPILKNK
jgi:hypothetical protein